MTMRQAIRPTLGLLITGAALWVAAGLFDWAEVWQLLLSASPWWLLAGVGFLAVDFALRILRWQGMLRAVNPAVGYLDATRPFLTSFALNNVLPLRAGDVYRVFGFRTKLGMGASPVLASLLLERILDFLTLLAFLAIGLPLLAADAVDDRLLLAMGGGLGVVTVFGVLVLFFPGFFTGLLNLPVWEPLYRKVTLAGKIRQKALEALDSLRLMASGPRLLKLLLLSAVAWLLEGAVFFAAVESIGLDGWTYAPWFALAMGTLVTLVPSSPGYVGTFELAVSGALVLFAFGKTDAIAVAILVHLLLWAPVTLAGLGLWFAGPKKLSKEEFTEANPPSTPEHA